MSLRCSRSLIDTGDGPTQTGIHRQKSATRLQRHVGRPLSLNQPMCSALRGGQDPAATIPAFRAQTANGTIGSRERLCCRPVHRTTKKSAGTTGLTKGVVRYNENNSHLKPGA